MIVQLTDEEIAKVVALAASFDLEGRKIANKLKKQYKKTLEGCLEDDAKGIIWNALAHGGENE